MAMLFRLDLMPLEFAAPEALRPVLDEKSGVDALWGDEDYPGMWAHQLSTELRPEIGRLGRHASDELSSIQGPAMSFGDALLRTPSSVALLMLVKQYAAAELAHPNATLPRAIAGAVYHLAIARAASDFGRFITSLDRSALQKVWRESLSHPWLDSPSRSVFEAAMATRPHAQ